MAKNFKIELNKPYFDHSDEVAILSALRSGRVSGDERYGQALRFALQKKLGVRYALPTPSCTAALELAIMAVDIKKGDEVILPSFNFASGVTAILRSGAEPVFAEIDPRTFCVDPDSIERMITSRTKAIMVVHYAGQACDMGRIMKIARRHKLKVIEDAAHALGGMYSGRPLGTIGDIGCYSFHGTKNIVTGEGGAFVTNDPETFARAEIMREKGTNRPAFLRGEAGEYGLVSKGGSYLLGDILSALAVSQLNKLEKITKLRTRNAEYLSRCLSDLKSKIVLPEVRPYAKSCWHIFALLVDPAKRGSFIQKLKQRGVDVSSHYLPLHSSVLGKRLNWRPKVLPVTDLVADSIVRLPVHPSLTKAELNYMVDVIHEAADAAL